MASRVGDIMARLGGGDKTILDEVPQDRMRFAQMAGVLFTTAGIATLSMTFALHNAVGAALYAAILFGLVWGVIIFNLDRFLVLSMGDTRTRGWRLFWLVVPRFALAVLVAAVVSTPLVLRIFASDINTELSNIHQADSKNFATLLSHSADQQLANRLKQEIGQDNHILNGIPPQPIISPQLQADRAQVKADSIAAAKAFKNKQAAYLTWQCEQDGETCGGASGLAGNGGRAHTDYLAYLHAKSIYQQDEKKLKTAQAAETKDQGIFSTNQRNRLQQLKDSAEKSLPRLVSQYNAVEKRIRRAIKKEDTTLTADIGILAQLKALSAASAHDSSLNAARWTLLALFFVIEILPVTVKVLLNLGFPTSYERIAIGREDAVTDREEQRRSENRQREKEASEARLREASESIKLDDLAAETRRKIAEGRADSELQVEQDMRGRELDIGVKANEYVASEMMRVVEVALQEWGERIRRDLRLGEARAEAGTATGAVADTATETQSPNGQAAGPGDETKAKRGYELPDEDRL